MPSTAKKSERHMAAILFCDIVGFSDLSSRNEVMAFRLLKEHREIVHPLVEKHQGRIIKTMGDGFLAEFATASGATLCAIEMQIKHVERNQKANPSQKIQVRIGVHAGDVMPSEGDIYGAGVNIAARLMALAHPGRICVSAAIMDQVRQIVPYWVSTLGPKKLKGIENPVQAYAICVEYAAAEFPPLQYSIRSWFLKNRQPLYAILILLTLAGSAALWQPADLFDPHRIAVAPLKGLGSEQNNFAAGITEELISSLSKVEGLRVLAQSSTSMALERNSGVHEFGRELQVGGLVEGSVQRENGKIRIRVRLTDTRTSENRWAEDFEGDTRDIFEFQKAIARSIAEKFTGIKQLEISNAHQPSSEAYQRYLAGLSLIRERTSSGLSGGLAEFSEAILRDGAYAPAHSAAAITCILMNFYGYVSPQMALEKGEKFARRALEIDPRNSDALLWYAEKYAYDIRDQQRANSFYRQAIAANPSSSIANNWYGQYLAVTGNFLLARSYFSRALELDPLSPVAIAASSLPDYYEGNYEKSLAILHLAASLDPKSSVPQRYLGKVFLARKDFSRAEENLRQAWENSKDSMEIQALLAQAVLGAGRRAEADRLWTAVLRQSRTSFSPHYFLGRTYLAFGETEKALEELALSQKDRENQALHMRVDPLLEELRGNPRFEMLLPELPKGPGAGVEN